MGTASDENLLAWNAQIHRCKGVGRWRELYLPFLEALAPTSVVEFGSGDPSFLASLPGVATRLALDGNAGLAPLYEAQGIRLCAFDFDRDEPPADLSGFAAAVCSDVFEHLIYPQRLLGLIHDALSEGGVLFSHVPNEYRLRHTVRVMLGRRPGVVHHDAEEWNDPHLRRFTDLGYRRFLATRFRFHLKLDDLRYGRTARVFARLGLGVPYCLEHGPTYASTDSQEMYRRLVQVKARLKGA